MTDTWPSPSASQPGSAPTGTQWAGAPSHADLARLPEPPAGYTGLPEPPTGATAIPRGASLPGVAANGSAPANGTGYGTREESGPLPRASASKDSFASEVAALKIRGGTTRIERQIRIGGAVVMAVGVVLILLAWLRASAPNTSVNNQIAYLISGGILGIALVGIGAAGYLRSWIARLRYWEARQVVESREYAAQVLIMLSRIEKLLGGTGELPGEGRPDHEGSLWDHVGPPPEAQEQPELIGDPFREDVPGQDAQAGRALSASEGSERPTTRSDQWGATKPAETGSDQWDTTKPAETGSDQWGATQPAETGSDQWDTTKPAETGSDQWANSESDYQQGGDPNDGSEIGLPVYTNEHGHIWDHQMNQWYDPGTHQWFDGIAGRWYQRDAPPPRL